MVDVVFPLSGTTLADDHADGLSMALRAALPWFDDEPEAGILPLSGLARGSGRCYVGGRSRLVLRLPMRRSASADVLCGARLDIDGELLTVGAGRLRPLLAAPVVHSPFVDVETADEIEFLARCRALLAERRLNPQLLSGRARQLNTAAGPLRGFSLMLHGAGAAEMLTLQETGLGVHRALGCGIFVPHKSIAAVGD